METRTKLILDDFLRDTLRSDRDSPFVDQEKLENNLKKYSYLYSDFDAEFIELFAYIHYKLNDLFEFWNEKYNPKYGGHFNADQSRELILLIEHLKSMYQELKGSTDEISIGEPYFEVINRVYPLLSNSEGSAIPPNFGRIEITKHSPIFSVKNTVTKITNTGKLYKVTLIGTGSYAIVKKYFDEHYQRWFAVKQAKKDLTDKELLRFKKEYSILATIKFPYILEVFTYDEADNSYTMEFCDFSLQKYITANNQKLSFTARKKMALQFLYGVNYLYTKDYLHRDLSWNNILVKLYDSGVTFIKISDFGLVKEKNSELTDDDTSGKGSTFHKDPLLESFKDIKIENEIYSVGFILNFIFIGKQNLARDSVSEKLGQIIDKCTDNKSLDNRYHNVLDIIHDIELIQS